MLNVVIEKLLGTSPSGLRRPSYRADGLGVKPRALLVPLGLATALSLFGDATLYAILPTHAAEAGIALGAAGVLLGINRAVRLLTNLLAGAAYDTWRGRRLFVLSVFVGALSTLLYGLTRGFWPLAFARVLWGCSWSGIWVGGTSMVLDVTDGSNRGRWLGIYQVWFFVGTGLGALIGGWFTDLLGFRTTMFVCSSATAAGGLAALLFLPETAHATLQPSVASPDSRAKRSPWMLVTILREAPRTLRTAVLVEWFNRLLFAGLLSATLSLIVRDRISPTLVRIGTSTLTGILSSARTLLSLAAAPLAGILLDRTTHRRTSLAVVIALAAASMVCLALDTPLPILLGLGSSAVAAGSMSVLSRSLAGEASRPKSLGTTIGLLHAVGDLGSAIGPPLSFLLLPYAGLQGLSVGGAVLLLALLLIVCDPFRLRRSSGDRRR